LTITNCDFKKAGHGKCTEGDSEVSEMDHKTAESAALLKIAAELIEDAIEIFSRTPEYNSYWFINAQGWLADYRKLMSVVPKQSVAMDLPPTCTSTRTDLHDQTQSIHIVDALKIIAKQIRRLIATSGQAETRAFAELEEKLEKFRY
jgi:hypothetical protein